MKKGLCVRPEKGDAVLFWSVVSEGGEERGGSERGDGGREWEWGGVGGRAEGVGVL